MNGSGAEALVGQTVKGWLKRMKDGWGFMNSDQFAGDLFVHARENPGISDYPVKTEFFFTVGLDPKGKPMATNSTPANPGAAAAVKEPMTVETGQRLIGTVKSFTDHWGFVRTDEGKDYFFNERSIETFGGELPPVGSTVYFSTAPDNQKPDKVMAVNLQTIQKGNGVYSGDSSRKRTATDAGMVAHDQVGYDQAGMMGMVAHDQVGYDQAGMMGMYGGITTVEQLEGALLTLPSMRLFQLAEMKMRMEAATAAGTMGGMMY